MQLLPSYVLIGGFLSSFLMSFLAAPFFIRIAHRFSILDMPDGALKLHQKPTPYLGGCAILIGFWGTLEFLGLLSHEIRLLSIASFMLLVLGFIDDMYRIAHYQKFIGQALIACWLVAHGLYLKSFFSVPSAGAYFVSWFWLVTIMNAFNLIDVMDGLATITALGVAVQLWYINLMTGSVAITYALSCFMGSLLAFLRYNYPPARMYMGDAGSLFIGGFLGAIPLCMQWPQLHGMHSFLVLLTIFALPLYELGSLIVLRTLKGIPFYQGSPDHFAIRLQHKGWKKGSIINYIVATSMFFLILHHFLFSNGITVISLLFGVFLITLPLIFLLVNNIFSILHQIYQK